MKKFRKKALTIVTAIVLIIAVVATLILLPENSRNVKSVELSELAVFGADIGGNENYDRYCDNNKALSNITDEIIIPFKKTVTEGKTENIEFNAKASVASIEVEYKIVSEKISDGECSVYINGKLPFREAESINLRRKYLTNYPEKDVRGNMYAPTLNEINGTLTSSLNDVSGYHTEPFRFALKDGVNTISFTSSIGNIYIEKIRLYNYKAPDSYAQVSKNYPTDKLGADNITIEAEYPYTRSNASVAEICDRNSAATLPIFDGLQVWNALGDSSWSEIGEQASWKFNVEKTGLYKISFRFKQNFTSGVASNRKLLIDGEVPFNEMNSLTFPYDTGWQTMTVKSDINEPYYFYLDKGEHTIVLEVTLGDWAETLNAAQNLLSELNSIYRRIIMLTGSSPDTYRDYEIAAKLPDVITDMKNQIKVVEKISDWVYLYNGAEGEGTAVLDKIVRDLKNFVKYPETIPSELSDFMGNLSSLSTWIQGRSAQPLTLDCIQITSNETNNRKTDAGILTKSKHGILQFLRSFSDDYGKIGNLYEQEKALEVWFTLGRDQYQVLKELIDNSFIKESGINANLKLVSVGILEAMVAGIAPDVFLFSGEGDPVNFASRGALEDLTQFSDYDEVIKRFSKEALLPYQYNGSSYALPLTQSFPVMFVRDDLLEEIGLKAPKTWDDVYNMLTILQQNNMEFAFEVPPSGYTLLLFQKQRKLYKDGGKSVNIDTPEAIEAFEKWVSLYSEYSSLMSYNFVNRFRTGDMPIGIADFGTSNTLELSAPEIKGLWNMYPIPGTINENGEIEHITTTATTGSIIIKGSRLKQEAWEFLKWFTRKDVQSDYANKIESRLGASGRYYSANIEAFNNLPLSVTTLNTLNGQRSTAISVEQVPGGYFLTRHINNIFRKIVNEKTEVRETVLEYTDIINKEITKKRKEFGLEVSE